MVPNNLNVLNYPIVTEDARRFWASRHKCNKMKSIIAFSLNFDNANDNLRRYGYTRAWRKKALVAFGKYVNMPSMASIPFSDLSTPWWVCMPASGIGPLPPTPDPGIFSFTVGQNGASQEWGYNKGSFGSVADESTAIFDKFTITLDPSDYAIINAIPNSNNPLLGKRVLYTFSDPDSTNIVSVHPLHEGREIQTHLNDNTISEYFIKNLGKEVTVTVQDPSYALRDWLDIEYWDDTNLWGY